MATKRPPRSRHRRALVVGLVAALAAGPALAFGPRTPGGISLASTLPDLAEAKADAAVPAADSPADVPRSPSGSPRTAGSRWSPRG